MPLNLSFTHLAVVAIVALVVLGPDRLPEAARSAARWHRKLREVTDSLQSGAQNVLGEVTEPLTGLVDALTGVTTPTTDPGGIRVKGDDSDAPRQVN